MRVLHVIRNLELSGVQKWVLNLVETPRPTGVTMDVLVLQEPVDEEIADAISRAGCRLHTFTRYHSVRNFIWFAWSAKRAGLKYDILHAHVDYLGGVLLWIAKIMGIPVRLQHAHIILSHPQLGLTLLNWRWWILGLIRSLIATSATGRLAVSISAGRSIYGADWPKRPGDQVLHPAIPAPELLSRRDRVELRSSIGLPQSAIVVGHVSRLRPVKNQRLLLEVFRAYLDVEPNAWLVVVGDGPDYANLIGHCRSLGLESRVIWLGHRHDAMTLLQIFDVSLLPSNSESFSLVAAECQAVGVPIITTTGTPQGPFRAQTSFYARLEPDAGLNTWIETIRAALALPEDRQRARTLFAASDLEIAKNHAQLLSLYALSLDSLSRDAGEGSVKASR